MWCLPWYVLEQRSWSSPYSLHLGESNLEDTLNNIGDWKTLLSFSSTSLQFQVQSTMGGSRSHLYMAIAGYRESNVTFLWFKPRHNEEPRLNRRPRDTHFHLWRGSSQDCVRLRESVITPRHMSEPSWKKAKSSDSTGAVQRESERDRNDSSGQ